MKPDNAPGCYGSPLCYQDQRLPCSKCPYLEACGPEALNRAEALRERFNIRAALAAKPPRGIKSSIRMASPAVEEIRKPAPSVRVAPVAPRDPGSLPKKSQELVDSLARKGIDLKRALEMNSNPFDHKPPRYMQVVFRMLLDGGFERAQLSERLSSELDWTKGTADAHVSLSVPALKYLGVAVDDGSRIIPNREAESASIA